MLAAKAGKLVAPPDSCQRDRDAGESRLQAGCARQGRKSSTSFLIVNAQSVRNTDGAREKGCDAQVADRWGRVQASAGRTLPATDGLLAATALQHDLTLVTRNTKDFAGLNLRLIDPWEA